MEWAICIVFAVVFILLIQLKNQLDRLERMVRDDWESSHKLFAGTQEWMRHFDRDLNKTMDRVRRLEAP